MSAQLRRVVKRDGRRSIGWPLSLVSSFFFLDSVQCASRGAGAAGAAFMQPPAAVGRGGLWRGGSFAGCKGRAVRGFAAPPPRDKAPNFLRALQKLQAIKKEEAGQWREESEGGKEAQDDAAGVGSVFKLEPAEVLEREIIEDLSQGGLYDPNQVLQSMLDEDESDDYKFKGPKRCGTVAIVGAPNAGKSTLLNRLIGSKLAIVTHKRQTTRNSVTGIAMEDGTQVVYIDTPGIMDARPGQRLNKVGIPRPDIALASSLLCAFWLSYPRCCRTCVAVFH